MIVSFCFGVQDGEKLTRLVVLAVVDSLLLLLLFIINCGDSNIFLFFLLDFSYLSDCRSISKACQKCFVASNFLQIG